MITDFAHLRRDRGTSARVGFTVFQMVATICSCLLHGLIPSRQGLPNWPRCRTWGALSEISRTCISSEKWPPHCLLPKFVAITDLQDVMPDVSLERAYIQINKLVHSAHQSSWSTLEQILVLSFS